MPDFLENIVPTHDGEQKRSIKIVREEQIFEIRDINQRSIPKMHSSQKFFCPTIVLKRFHSHSLTCLMKSDMSNDNFSKKFTVEYCSQ